MELVELNPELGTYFGVERGVLVMEVDEGRMHVSRGNPCQTPYQTYTL